MSQSSYVLSRDVSGADRLRLLGRLLGRSTEDLLLRAGLAPGLRCLDLGCGVGTVTILMARRLGPQGLAVGIDCDERFLDRARLAATDEGADAVFRRGDAGALEAERGYDLVYARFLLSHLPDPARAVAQLVAAARPGGTVVVEDVDFAGHFCHPPSDAFDRYVELYRAVVRGRGADPEIGRRLAELLEAAGVARLRLKVVQPAFREGEGKQIARATMDGIRAAVIDAGLATRADVDAIVADLLARERDRQTIMSLARVFQVWGHRPDREPS
jgi:ubiquinone/menaquinone biosynthesis C-methylase UbiE